MNFRVYDSNRFMRLSVIDFGVLRNEYRYNLKAGIGEGFYVVAYVVWYQFPVDTSGVSSTAVVHVTQT